MAEEACVLGGRIRVGDRVARVRQHQYIHEADLHSIEKTIEIVLNFDWSALRSALQQVGEQLSAMATAMVESAARAVSLLQPVSLWSPDSLAFDSNPDRCWKCDAKPGVEELDGACWRCHYDLTK